MIDKILGILIIIGVFILTALFMFLIYVRGGLLAWILIEFIVIIISLLLIAELTLTIRLRAKCKQITQSNNAVFTSIKEDVKTSLYFYKRSYLIITVLIILILATLDYFMNDNFLPFFKN